MKSSVLACVFLLVCQAASAPARAELKPEWELGAGVAGLDFPLYRGAAEHRQYLLPAPYVQYRGDFFRVDHDQVKGMLLQGDRVDVDLSFSGSVPVSSQASSARQGMPDLDPTVEVGPEAQVHLYASERRAVAFDLLMPVRPVFAINLNRFSHVGWVFQPKFNMDVLNVAGSGWNLGLQTGWLFGDRGANAYFYDVSPAYATAARPAYYAPAGYAGAQSVVALGRRMGQLWMGFFAKYDDLRGAVFADSPLVQRREDYSAGFLIAWVFAHSERMVDEPLR